MDSPEQRRKRKQTQSQNRNSIKFLSLKSLALCISFFVFVLLISSEKSLIRTPSFRPVLRVPALSLLPSRVIRGSLISKMATLPPLVVEDRVLFPDHLLLIVSSKVLHSGESLECVYYALNSSCSDSDCVVSRPVMGVDVYNEGKFVVRCEVAGANYSAVVDLRWTGEGDWGNGLVSFPVNRMVVVPSWDKVVYEAVLDRNTVVVFVKGLNLQPHKVSDPSRLRCHFGLSGFGGGTSGRGFVFTTEANAAAQEVVRCMLPRGIRSSAEKAKGVRVTVSRIDDIVDGLLPSVAKVDSVKPRKRRYKKYKLCACTMLWNQASFMREWIMYHAWLGVERWFVYDNDSDDRIQEVIDELNSENFNISRHAWPWNKAQEAGFSHCALRARHECRWLGFFDVDEFFYIPRRRGQDLSGQNSLKMLVANKTSSRRYGEIRTSCHSYGPSGLTSVPQQGVTVAYTCRLMAPERHKSFVRPDLLDPTLLNVVHHFKLQEGYRYLNVPENVAVVNHYKYQAWDTFKAKFFRRVSTYVANWQDDENQGSKDRAPGLGTVAIEPPDWRLRFCEVWDTGLKDFVLANFADPPTGWLPWERPSL